MKLIIDIALFSVMIMMLINILKNKNKNGQP